MLKLKERKPYTPTRVEVAKTVLIAVLVTAIGAFIAGVQYADNYTPKVQAAQVKK